MGAGTPDLQGKGSPWEVRFSSGGGELREIVKKHHGKEEAKEMGTETQSSRKIKKIHFWRVSFLDAINIYFI